MRVLHFIDVLYIGGAEKLLVTFSELSRKYDIDVSVGTLKIYPETPFLEGLRRVHVPVTEFLGRNLFDPLRFFRLVRFLRSEKFDIIHVHLTYSIILGSLAAKLAGLPVVATIHNVQSNRWENLEIFALRNWVAVILGVGYEVSKVYRSKLKNKRFETVVNTVTMPELITPQKRKEMRSYFGIDDNQVLIVAIGRLSEQKGYDDLLDAMLILKNNKIRARLLIVGDGELYDHLTARITELDLDEIVILTGSRNDVIEILAASDIFVNSSHWEGLPVALLEAMAAGLPVVATNVGDIPNVVKKNIGVLVYPHRPDLLAASLKQFCIDAELRGIVGQNALSYVNTNHNPDDWMKKILGIYKQLI